MSETSRRIIGQFKPCKDGEICTLEESLLASQNPLRDQATFPPPSIQVKIHSHDRTFKGEQLMTFDARFTPAGSSEDFKAQLYLQSTLDGYLRDGYYGQNGRAHFFTKGPNVLKPMIDDTKLKYPTWGKEHRLNESEFDVYDTRCTHSHKSGERCFEVGNEDLYYGGRNAEWDISLSNSTRFIDKHASAESASYAGKLWLSIPGYDPETGTVRGEDAFAETAALAGAENELGQLQGDQEWVVVDD